MPHHYRFNSPRADGAEFVLSDTVKREEPTSSLDEAATIELFAIAGILFDRG